MVISLRPLDSASSECRLKSFLRAVLGCFLKAGHGIIFYFESKNLEEEIIVFLTQGRWVGRNELRAPKFQSVIWSLVLCGWMVTRQDSVVARVLG